MPPAVKAPSPNHWTAREVPRCKGFKSERRLLSGSALARALPSTAKTACPAHNSEAGDSLVSKYRTRSNTRGQPSVGFPTAAKGDSGLFPAAEWVRESAVEGTPLLHAQKNVWKETGHNVNHRCQ